MEINFMVGMNEKRPAEGIYQISSVGGNLL